LRTSQRAVMFCGCGVKAGVVRVWVPYLRALVMG